MTTFNYLKENQVKENAIRSMELCSIDIPNNGGKLVKFYGKFAGKNNSPYVAATAKLTTKRDIKNLQKGRIDMQRSKEKDLKVKEIFSKYVLTDWEHVVDDTGKKTEFSQELCFNFLKQLPDEAFDEIADFFSDYENFTNKTISMTEDEAVARGNDSEK